MNKKIIIPIVIASIVVILVSQGILIGYWWDCDFHELLSLKITSIIIFSFLLMQLIYGTFVYKEKKKQSYFLSIIPDKVKSIIILQTSLLHQFLRKPSGDKAEN